MGERKLMKGKEKMSVVQVTVECLGLSLSNFFSVPRCDDTHTWRLTLLRLSSSVGAVGLTQTAGVSRSAILGWESVTRSGLGQIA